MGCMADIRQQSIEDKWVDASRHVAHHRREHALNHAYLEGYQWLTWSPLDLDVDTLIADNPDRIQASFNHMRSNMRTIISKLTQRELTFEVPASSYDDATLKAARTAESILVELHRDHNWEVKREGHLKAVMKGGTGVVAVDWDPLNETSVETVLGVPSFVVEPGAIDLETARWWIKLQVLPPQEVKSMFPEDFEGSEPEADGRLSNLGDYKIREEYVPLTRVLTYYERPNPLTPDGKICVEVNGKILQRSDWPFPWKHRLNIAAAKESLIESEAYGSTILSDVRSPQSALNAAWSGYLENMREASTSRLVIDENWVDAIDHLNDRAGAVLSGPMAKGKPDWLKAPPIPQALMEGIQLLRAEIDNLMGVHDVSRGEAPQNIESGFGLSILAEQDSSPAGRLIKETGRVWSRVGWMVLELHAQEIKKERTTVVRQGNGPTVRKWTGKMLRGQTNALVPLEAIIPRSQAAQMQFAQQAVQMGLISPDDPLAVMRFAKLADMPDKRGIIAATLPDADKATRENEMVIMGQIPLPADFDNHAMHIQIHNEGRKTTEHDLLTPEMQSVWQDHIKAHEVMAQQQMAISRQASDIDPALGAAPRADGAPPVEPLPPAQLGPPPEEAAAAEGPVDAEVDAAAAADQVIKAIEQFE